MQSRKQLISKIQDVTYKYSDSHIFRTLGVPHTVLVIKQGKRRITSTYLIETFGITPNTLIDIYVNSSMNAPNFAGILENEVIYLTASQYLSYLYWCPSNRDIDKRIVEAAEHIK